MEHLTGDLPKTKPSSPNGEEKKRLSQKRLFWAVTALDAVIAVLIVFVILEALIG